MNKKNNLLINRNKNGRIFLLQTPIEEISQEKHNDHNVTYPLGLAYLDSVLKNEGNLVISKEYASHSNKNYLDDISKIIKEFKPQIVGISVLTMTRVSTYKAINFIKKIDPSIKIILGGVHASVLFSQLLDNFNLSAIVMGEGEETVKELIPALLSNSPLDKIKGIAFKKNSKIIKTEDRPLISNLDSLPFPNHDIFANPKRERFCILSSRGCPNNCSFCCLHFFGRRIFRQRSADNIIDEIKYLIKKYPKIKEIEFSDDTFTLNMSRVIEFCNKIIQQKINLKFICSGRIKPASYEMFQVMEKAGFIEIRFGVETGSNKMLKSIHKNITKEEILETLKICSHFKKIKIVKLLMVGFPGETWETVEETIDFVRQMQKIVYMDFFNVSPLWVYPGTEVYQIMKDKKMINDDFWLTDKDVPYYTVEHPLEELMKMSKYIAWESAKANGLSFLVPFVFKKIAKHPIYQFKRAVNQFLPAILYRLENKNKSFKNN